MPLRLPSAAVVRTVDSRPALLLGAARARRPANSRDEAFFRALRAAARRGELTPALYRRIRPGVEACVGSLLQRSEHPQDFEEAVSACMPAVELKVRKSEPGIVFSVWREILLSAREIRRRLWRRLGRGNCIEIDVDTESGAETSPEAHLDAMCSAEALEQALGAVKPRPREIVVACTIFGEPTAEVAARLGASPRDVRRILRRATICLGTHADEILSRLPGAIGPEG
jgi:RNA polymerase sigma factor (sigma-70 family)